MDGLQIIVIGVYVLLMVGLLAWMWRMVRPRKRRRKP